MSISVCYVKNISLCIHYKLAYVKMIYIALFKSITMFSGTNNIMWNTLIIENEHKSTHIENEHTIATLTQKTCQSREPRLGNTHW
jgi:hypothetical protein